MEKDILIDGTLYHHGIPGQKWGQRRFQNEDGSLTPEGRERYGLGKKNYSRKEWKQVKADMRSARNDYTNKYEKRNAAELKKAEKNVDRKRELYEKAHRDYEDYLYKGELGKTIYDTNTKRAKNAYAKAQLEYDQIAKKGQDYVERKMKEQFGQDYSDWIKETTTKATVATGAAITAGYAMLVLVNLYGSGWHRDY